MLMPKRTKYRKMHRGSFAGNAHRGTKLLNGDIGLRAVERGMITSAQIESARIAITRAVKRGGKMWINIFPHKVMTARAAETRMGGGKGAPDHWVAVVKPGRIMFELGSVTDELGHEAMRRAAHKLPIKCKVVTREDEDRG